MHASVGDPQEYLQFYDSQDSVCSHTELLQQKDTKQIQQREKAQGVKCGGNQEQDSKRPPALKSDRPA